jgi:hypothetical protein
MPWTPSTARIANQPTITGPNNRPTVAVPRLWTRNNATRITAAIGTTRCSSDGWTTSRPSTAESTEIAGVIIESPKNSDAPKMPTAISDPSAAGFAPERRTSSAISAMIPPSPSLSARMTNTTYSSVTTIMTAQNTSEITPYTASGSTGTGRAASRLNTVWTA